MVADSETPGERLTEEEWVVRYNANMAESILSCEGTDVEISETCDVFAVMDCSTPCIALDSGATSSVVGENWVTQCLGKETVKESQKSNKKFRFGDARTVNCQGGIEIPITAMRTDGKTRREF